MREITLFLHSQKIQRPEPIVSSAILRLMAITGLTQGNRTAVR